MVFLGLKMRHVEQLLKGQRPVSLATGGMVFDVKGAAKLLHEPERQVRKMIRAGLVVTCWIDGRRWIPRSELRRIRRYGSSG